MKEMLALVGAAMPRTGAAGIGCGVLYLGQVLDVALSSI